MRADDVKDQRTHPDAAFRGVVLFLRATKTGLRQSVSVSDPAVATLLVCWRDARVQVAGADATLFPPAATLRTHFHTALTALEARTAAPSGWRSCGTACAMVARVALSCSARR